MSRLTGLFADLGKQGRAALIPFVTAGDPSLSVMVPLLHALVAAGADAIELGVPFSDPMADGPIIQRASERALARGVKMRMALEWVREFRLHNQHTPIILMGYLNPVEAMGAESFALAAKDAGVDGVILVDLPPEEGADYADLLKNHQIDPIFLLAPTSGAERVAAVKAIGSGFVYYVSLRGITGAAQADWQEVLARVATLRRSLAMPVAIGFGIRDAETVALVAPGADAVVVGSALVERLSGCTSDAEVLAAAQAFMTPLAKTIAASKGVSA